MDKRALKDSLYAAIFSMANGFDILRQEETTPGHRLPSGELWKN